MGNAQIGFNAIQGTHRPSRNFSSVQNFVAMLICFLRFAERIAGFHGSQCGFCTPGMVVACHTALSIAHNKGEKCTPMQMEKAFDGNLCRCTGYRPILDGCKVSRSTLILPDQLNGLVFETAEVPLQHAKQGYIAASSVSMTADYAAGQLQPACQ